jgi:hypothetical protein
MRAMWRARFVMGRWSMLRRKQEREAACYILPVPRLLSFSFLLFIILSGARAVRARYSEIDALPEIPFSGTTSLRRMSTRNGERESRAEFQGRRRRRL